MGRAGARSSGGAAFWHAALEPDGAARSADRRDAPCRAILSIDRRARRPHPAGLPAGLHAHDRRQANPAARSVSRSLAAHCDERQLAQRLHIFETVQLLEQRLSLLPSESSFGAIEEFLAQLPFRERLVPTPLGTDDRLVGQRLAVFELDADTIVRRERRHVAETLVGGRALH